MHFSQTYSSILLDYTEKFNLDITLEPNRVDFLFHHLLFRENSYKYAIGNQHFSLLIFDVLIHPIRMERQNLWYHELDRQLVIFPWHPREPE